MEWQKTVNIKLNTRRQYDQSCTFNGNYGAFFYASYGRTDIQQQTTCNNAITFNEENSKKCTHSWYFHTYLQIRFMHLEILMPIKRIKCVCWKHKSFVNIIQHSNRNDLSEFISEESYFNLIFILQSFP